MKRYLITKEGKIGEEIGIQVSPDKVSSADFEMDEGGNLTLLRWSRTADFAIVPEKVDGHTVTGIAPLCFAAFHLPKEAWAKFTGTGSMSFSIFCMMNAGRIVHEGKDDGGPSHIDLPETVTEIGQYAFWHCDRLQDIRVSSHVKLLKSGTFGECSQLQNIVLPEDLEQLGEFYPDTVHVMPDIGTFAGCNSLKNMILPKSLQAIGCEVFNSCGLESLMVEDDHNEKGAKDDVWNRTFKVHSSAFNHTASLQWMSRLVNHEIAWQIGLPVGRDKILACDKKYNIISKIPVLFFGTSVFELDQITKESFRLDFAGRMAIGRLRYPQCLDEQMHKWYLELLVEYFDKLEQFWPKCNDKQDETFSLLCSSSLFTAQLLSRLMYIAGKAHMKTELLFRMQEVRNSRFSSITGLEDLEL